MQTARNVFRGYPPEFIEVDAAPEAITPATRADLEKEIKHLQSMREIGLKQIWEWRGAGDRLTDHNLGCTPC